MERYDDIELYTQVYTFSELKKEVDEEWESMSEEEKYLRLKDNSPTFKTYCLGFIAKEKDKKIEINEYTCTYKIVE